MPRYAIGDIQGCYTTFIKLLAKIDFNPSRDKLYLVGDLVNRGKESLQVLRWAYKNQDNFISVLGNHDIYLLARYNNLRIADQDDTISDILTDSNSSKMIDWLRSRPLIYQDSDYIIVHAGIYPIIDFNHLVFLNHQISQHLQSIDYVDFINKVYGNKPNYWNHELPQYKQMKFIVNACTRMRYLNTNDYSLDYRYKGELVNKLIDIVPWFTVDFHTTITKKIIFGHWASLGLYQSPKCIGIDTGCVWGRKLTALNLDNMEIIQENHPL
ncbi:MAG: symmetrical bis(5'-nucleosyl)-tetraphosphatase [Burkholderiales bacterium]|nr:symmetrical bis(5'-nucleosyl)-tetraphosphatase [Burkholderiales bacterium]